MTKKKEIEKKEINLISEGVTVQDTINGNTYQFILSFRNVDGMTCVNLLHASALLYGIGENLAPVESKNICMEDFFKLFEKLEGIK